MIDCRHHTMIRIPLLLMLLAMPMAASATQEDFNACLASLQTRATDAGLPAALVDAVVPALTAQERVLSLDRKQPEFVQTFSQYLDARVTPQRVSRGRELLAQHRDFLLELQARYGIPPQYLVSFWGLETNFGGYLGNMPTLDSLATLACDPRRSEFFTSEFIDALRLLQRESLSPDDMRGSWAGAVGHTQFMPSSYLRYAVDGDGDGRINLWLSEQDALASGANYLQQIGWQPGLRWGREVRAGADFPFELAGRGRPRALADWIKSGLTRPDGAPLPAADLEAALILPGGHQGPAFLVYANFHVIMRWNRSELYALAVGHLADRIAGGGALSKASGNEAPLRNADIARAQATLNRLGFDAGEVDGVLGTGTRNALRAYQMANQLIADGYPNPQTLTHIDQQGAEPTAPPGT